MPEETPVNPIEATIAAYRAAIEANPGLSKIDLEAELANGGSLEKQVAITGLLNEVNAVLDEQALAAWLTDNEVPDWQWNDYVMENGSPVYRPVVDTPDEEPEA